MPGVIRLGWLSKNSDRGAAATSVRVSVPGTGCNVHGLASRNSAVANRIRWTVLSDAGRVVVHGAHETRPRRSSRTCRLGRSAALFEMTGHQPHRHPARVDLRDGVRALQDRAGGVVGQRLRRLGPGPPHRTALDQRRVVFGEVERAGTVRRLRALPACRGSGHRARHRHRADLHLEAVRARPLSSIKYLMEKRY